MPRLRDAIGQTYNQPVGRAPLYGSDEERVELVKRIFSSITPRYDFLNRFLSGRRDVAWRRRAVREMRFPGTRRFLDVASGTGDLAIEAARAHPEIEVTGMDFVPPMLERGRLKAREMGLGGRVRFVEGDALALPFDAGEFDVAAMAFGIRNIPDREAALREMSRVVAPGGQVMVLELTTPESRMVSAVYGLYLNRILPAIGRFFSSNTQAYEYLARSILDFPAPAEFAATMRKAGLGEVSVIPLTLGVAHIYIGRTAPAAGA